ncbi:MAG TPA: hypothetical protein VFU58_06305 [Candidatus Nitrosotalea sp.]|nr:hypothetical protein [Candidatus Nitrosotalea sp.]
MKVKSQSHGIIMKSVFSRPIYFGMSAVIFIVMLIALLSANQLLFFEPYFTINLSQDLFLNFALIVILSALSGFVISITVFQIREFHSSKKVGTGIISSLIGSGTGVCTSCSTIGFSIVSTLGATGATVVSFLDMYSIPIKVASIFLLVASYFMMSRTKSTKCKI